MKWWLCVALAALMCVPALAEEVEAVDEAAVEEESYDDYEEAQEDRNIEGAQLLETDEVYHLDLDGDGSEETVQVRMSPVDDEEELQLLVETDELIYTYDTYILSEEAGYAVDLDGDGKLEILLTGDEASADYSTWCLKFSREGGLQPVKFADANRGENTNGYFDCGYGRVEAVNGNILTLAGTQDALGTWMCSRDFTLRDGRFELEDGGIWIVTEDLSDPENWEYRSLTATRELPVTLEDGGEGTLPVGTSLLITETDKQSYAGFVTKEGQRGRIAISPNKADGWGFLVNGENEYDCFEYVPYAD